VRSPPDERRRRPLARSAARSGAAEPQTMASITRITDTRQRRVVRVETAAGPWWGGYCLRSWSLAEASRSRWSA
jgi:hypothetical protein